MSFKHQIIFLPKANDQFQFLVSFLPVLNHQFHDPIDSSSLLPFPNGVPNPFYVVPICDFVPDEENIF